MPNNLAYFVLLSYPIIAIVLFRRLGLTSGLIWTLLAGYLFLPVMPVIELPLPGLPYIDKDFVPGISALILVRAQRRRTARLKKVRERRPPLGRRVSVDQAEHAEDTSELTRVRTRGGNVVNFLLIALIFGPILTTLTNSEILVRGGGKVQMGFALYDSGRAVITVLVMLIPFFLARRYLGSKEAQRVLLWALVVGGVIYGVLAMYEVRMSPSLNRQMYGFFAHEWKQHVRDGGYRAILFLYHGLRVAIFLAMGAVAIAACTRIPEMRKRRGLLVVLSVIMMAVIFLDKSLGALAIACSLVPMALLMPFRTQSLVAAAVAVTILTYPVLRSANIVPVDEVVTLATSISPERGASFGFRLRNEEVLLERASEKPLAGWGGQGRSLIIDDRGLIGSIPDGRWIITIGQFGWLGYIAEFGLLALPILLITLRSRTLQADPATYGLILVLTANLIDLIPNSALTPVTWLLAGALVGAYETQLAQNRFGKGNVKPRRTRSAARDELAISEA